MRDFPDCPTVIDAGDALNTDRGHLIGNIIPAMRFRLFQGSSFYPLSSSIVIFLCTIGCPFSFPHVSSIKGVEEVKKVPSYLAISFATVGVGVFLSAIVGCFFECWTFKSNLGKSICMKRT